MSILNDSKLFENGADVTTKDILKRYGDIINRPPPKQHHIVTNSPPRSRDGRTPTAPVFHRVDTDPTQSHAWERESSARPLGGPAPTQYPPNPAPANNTSNTNSNSNNLNNNTNNNPNPNQPRGHVRMRSAGSIQEDIPINGQNGQRNDAGPRPSIGAG